MKAWLTVAVLETLLLSTSVRADLLNERGSVDHCAVFVEWVYETVTVTAPCPTLDPTFATLDPACNTCPQTICGVLPVTICNIVPCTRTITDGGVIHLLPTTVTKTVTNDLQTTCLVSDGQTIWPAPVTRTCGQYSFITPTALPIGCGWEVLVLPGTTLPDGQVIPPETVYYTYSSLPELAPTKVPVTTTVTQGGSPVIKINNVISVHVSVNVDPATITSVTTITTGTTTAAAVTTPNGGASVKAVSQTLTTSVTVNPGLITTSASLLPSTTLLVGPTTSVAPIPFGSPFVVTVNNVLLVLSNGELTTTSGQTSGSAFTFDVAGNLLVNGNKIGVNQTALAANPTTAIPLYINQVFSVAKIAILGVASPISDITFAGFSQENGQIIFTLNGQICKFVLCSGVLYLSVDGSDTCPTVILQPVLQTSSTTSASAISTTSPAALETTTILQTTEATATIVPTTTEHVATTTANAATTTANAVTTTANAIATTTNAATTTANAATTTTTTATATASMTFEESMLYYHNAYRARNNAPALIWNTTLAAYALKRAQSCDTTNGGQLSPYGENQGVGNFKTASPFVYLWYKEQTSYNYSSPGFSDATGHFTQLVWVSSAQLGCAYYTSCKFTDTSGNLLPNYLVCEYSPFGNVDGQYQANVLPPTDPNSTYVIPPLV